jgi:TRAP-type uncharacterized transport system fused permease subunit
MTRFDWLEKIEGRSRTLTGFRAIVFNLTAAGSSPFHLYTLGFGLVSTQSNRGFYLMLTSTLLFPATRRSPKDRPSLIDLAFVGAAVASIGHWIDQNVSYASFRVSSPNDRDLAMGARSRSR